LPGQYRGTNFILARAAAVVTAAAALAGAAFLAQVAFAYAIAWPGSVPALERAARILPYTADSYAPDLSLQAGHLLDSQGRIAEGLAFYHASLTRDPYNNPGWLLAALAEESLGRPRAAEQAYLKAYAREPHRSESDWMYANFLLRQGRREESLGVFRRVLENGRRFDEPVFATLARMMPLAGLERRVLPPAADPQLAYLRYAMRAESAPAVARTWPRLAHAWSRISGPELTAICRLLACGGNPAGARAAWLDWMGDHGTRTAAPLFNGGFESEPAAGPYDWMFYSGPALDAFRDTGVYRSPGASGHLYFTGAENFEGTALEQWLPLEPGRRYVLSFAWRSRNVTSDRAPSIEIREGADGGTVASLETEPGTSPWRRERLPFRAPGALVRVAVARHASTKLDNRIAGDFWIDDVALEPE
jgi:tetratricopeptide (TPR) repeat protein